MSRSRANIRAAMARIRAQRGEAPRRPAPRRAPAAPVYRAPPTTKSKIQQAMAEVRAKRRSRGVRRAPPRRAPARSSQPVKVMKGAEVEAPIGSDGKFRRCVIVKRPKHGRWVNVYCDVSKTKVERVPTKLLRQTSDEGAADVEVEGGAPVAPKGARLPLRVAKGVEVEAPIGSDGKFRRCVIVKKPKHGRWVNVYCDVSKTKVERIPTKLLRQTSDEGAADVEVEGGAPTRRFGKRKFGKGMEIEAPIGTGGKFRRCVVVKRPKHGRWVNVYCDVTKKAYKRVPSNLLRQKSDEGAADVEYELPGPMPASTTLKDAMFPKKGQEVEVDMDGEWQRAQVVKCPKHRRWFNVYLDDSKQLVKRVEKSRLRPVDDDLGEVMDQLKPTRKAKNAYNPDARASSFKFYAHRSDKSGAIRAAMKRIMAARKRVASKDVAGVLQQFVPKKGVEIEAKIGTGGKYRRAVVVKRPRHGRWVHVYDDVEKKLVKRVPSNLLRQRSDDDNIPDDLEQE